MTATTGPGGGWPRPGDHAQVKCSDTRHRPAVCEDDRGVLVWRFADGALRRVDTTTAYRVPAPAATAPTAAQGAQ